MTIERENGLKIHFSGKFCGVEGVDIENEIEGLGSTDGKLLKVQRRGTTVGIFQPVRNFSRSGASNDDSFLGKDLWGLREGGFSLGERGRFPEEEFLVNSCTELFSG